MMGCCFEVEVVVIFTKQCYKYGHHNYLQIGGGPTCLSTTGSSADIRVTAWATALLETLINSNVSLEEIFAYVDDLRVVMRALIEGTRYFRGCKTLYYCAEQELEDRQNKESDNRRTAKIMLDVFNNIEKTLSSP